MESQLRDLARVITKGTTPNTAGFAFVENGIPFLRAEDIAGVTVDLSKVSKCISNECHAAFGRSQIEGGDVLVTIAGTIGRVAVMPPSAGTANCNQAVAIVKLKPDYVESQYLLYALRSPKVQGQLRQQGTTATIMNVSLSQIGDLRVPCPAKEEQRRVVDLLSRAEHIVRMRREAEAKAKEVIPALFVDMFGDPGTNPKGWPYVKFAELGPCRLGKMLDKKKESGANQCQYLRNVNVQWARIDTDDILEMEILPEDREKLSLKAGDLLICEGGEVGRAAIWDGRIPACYFQKALHRLRPVPTVATAEYVLWLLFHMSHRGMLSSPGAHATIAHLTGVQLANLQVPLPPVGIQRRFATDSNESGALFKTMEAARIASETVFQSMLANVFGQGGT